MQRILLPVAIGVTLTAWGSAFVVMRAVAPEFDPGPLSFGRLAIATVALGVFALWRGSWIAPTRPEWLLLLTFGVGWFAIYSVAVNAAVHEIDAGTTAMLVQVAPLIVALAAGVFLGEGVQRWLILGAVIAFAGVALIGLATSTADLGSKGVALAILAAVTYAIGVLAQKPLLGRLPTLQVTVIGVAIGAIGCVPWAPELAAAVPEATPEAILGMFYLGIVPTAIAFLLWGYALRAMPAGKLATLSYLVPVIATLLAWPLLDEVPPSIAILGGLVCIFGVALTRLAARPPRTV